MIVNAVRRMLYRPTALLETRLVRSARLMNRYPPLFIVGAPRSGTTLVYQHLVHRFRFAFFPNLSKRFPQACVAAATVARLTGRPDPTYTSRFGIMDGASAPSDGWDVFHRWFPRDDFTVPVQTERLHELRTIVRLLERLYEGPFLNKNNGNSVRVPALHGLFPDALFVHVERDLPSVVDSVLRARRDHGISPDAWWATPPPRFADRRFEDELELVVAQAWGLGREVREAFVDIDPDQRCSVGYEHFCADPDELARWVSSRYSARGVSLAEATGELPTSFTARRTARADDPEFRSAVEAIGRRLEAESTGAGGG